MATEKRAGIDEDKRNKREWWILVAFVLLCSALIWRDASMTNEIDARIDALIEDEKKLRAQVEELQERIAGHRLSHDMGRSAE